MGNKLALQNEALKQLIDYSDNIIKATKLVITELRNAGQDDTEELFNLVIQGINWEIEVFNNCEQLINKDSICVDKSKMASAVGRLGVVLQEKDDIKIAACLEVDFLPFLENMKKAGNNVVQ